MSTPAVPPQPQRQHPQLEVHFHFGPVNTNIVSWNIMAPEFMATAWAHEEQAQSPRHHFPFEEEEEQDEAMDPVDQDAMAEPERVEDPAAQAVAPAFYRRLLRKSKFVTLPTETHLHICEWLSVADILALRRTSMDMYKMTRNGSLWLSVIKRLSLLLPVLPPTSKYLHGEIKPSMAEYLTLRSLYLCENFTYRRYLAGSLARQETYDRILDIRVVPGAKFIVVLTENLRGEICFSIWELKLYKGGVRVPLVKVKLGCKPELFEVAYGTACSESHLFIAYAHPAIRNETTLQFVTKVSILGIKLELLEELAERNHTRDSFNAIMEECTCPFTVLYETSIVGKLQQIAMCDVQHTVLPNTLMVVMVCRPRLIMFDYPELREEDVYTGLSSFLSLGSPEIVNPTYPSSIWKIKLLPWQRCVLVSQVVTDPDGKDLQTVGFGLFRFPEIWESLNDPPCIQTQYLYGISVIGIYFSNLEEAWFSALRNPDKMLESQFHSAPPPVSIFVTTKGPNGLAHLMMNPTTVPGESILVRQGRGRVGKFEYKLPLETIRQETWKGDDMSFGDILPGAYFSLASLRPPMSCALDRLGPGVPKEVLRILGFPSQVRQYRLASVKTTGAYIHKNMEYLLEETDSIHRWDYPDLVLPGDRRPEGFPRTSCYLPAFGVPLREPSVSNDFQKGVTTIAFDESTGLLCYGVDRDSQLRFLDFGGRFRDAINVS